jgi:hypothetical protein
MLLDSATLITFDDEYKLSSYSLWNLQPPVTAAPFLDPSWVFVYFLLEDAAYLRELRALNL